jgi:diacylglycerol kinase (ATP)|nr:diacylglycerol kinase [Neorhizobium tomejilense]
MKPEKKSGFGHMLAATRYSLQGVKRLSLETAFRHEAGAAVFLVICMATVGASVVQIALGVALLIGVFASEAINTAIEEVVDHVSPDYSLAAKNAKDLGSLTVGLTVLAAYGYCLVVILVGLFA